MRNLYIDNKIEYIRNLFAEEDEILFKIRQDAIKINRPININPEDGKLLQLLMQLKDCKNVLEIGTFYGYSTIWLARSKEDIHILTIENDKNSLQIANENFVLANLNNKIKTIEDNAQNVLLKLNEYFDAVFIDADKNHYLEYLDWAESNIKKGGLIIADNSLLSGAVYMEDLPYRVRKNTRDNMQEFNRRLSNSNKYTSILIPAEDGITIAIKNF